MNQSCGVDFLSVIMASSVESPFYINGFTKVKVVTERIYNWREQLKGKGSISH